MLLKAKRPSQEQPYSEELYARDELARRRFLQIHNVTEDKVDDLVSKIILLDKDEKAPIQLLVNSSGGSVYEFFALYDVMRTVRSPIHTLGLGKMLSAGIAILASGEPGHRVAFRYATGMLHDLHEHDEEGGITHRRDVDVYNKHMQHLGKVWRRIMLKHTGLDAGALEGMLEIDSYLTAHELKKHGFVDRIR